MFNNDRVTQRIAWGIAPSPTAEVLFAKKGQIANC